MSPKDWKIAGAFFVVYIVWGSTFLANAWGVKEIPPFLMASVRFLIAGALIMCVIPFFQKVSITKKQLKNSAFAGFFLFAMGNGLAVWSLKFIDSGISAMMLALQPLIVAMMYWAFKGKPPGQLTWVGIALGITGMSLLVGQPQLSGSTDALMGVGAILIALLGWGYIAIWIPDADLPDSTMQRSAWQMLTGGAMLLIISPLLGEWNGFDWREVSAKANWSVVYLIIFGSIMAFSCFNYLLRTVSPTKVVTSTYVNPIIAMFLGWWLNSEEVTGQSLVAAAIMLAGVVFINKEKTVKTSDE